MEFKKLIIIGSGPAGYTAAIYACRFNIRTGLLTGDQPGGQLTTTTLVENWPGSIDGIGGIDLMEKMERQAKKFGACIVFDSVKRVYLKNKTIILYGQKRSYACSSVIISTGASPKYLSIPKGRAAVGKGVSTCAVCDGFFYRNKSVCIVGGGNTAFEESLYLVSIAKELFMFNRGELIKADIYIVKKFIYNMRVLKSLFINFNASILKYNTNQKSISSITLSCNKTGVKRIIRTNVVFLAIGHSPNTGLFKGQLSMKEGYIKIKTLGNNVFTHTSVHGVFASGDVVDNKYRQAITSSALGCISAMNVKEYMETPTDLTQKI